MVYGQTMEPEWGEAKSQRNLKLRGFDFAHAGLVFAGPVIESQGSAHGLP